MVVSLYDVGCFFGAMSLGYLADPIGRERTLAVACLVFIVGAVLQATSYSIAQIVRPEPCFLTAMRIVLTI
jgi:MFS family permease